MILKILIGLVVALFGFIILGAMLYNPNDPKHNARAAIALCWTDQAKKSNDPATARFIAGACEKAEADFRTKYGVSP